MIKKFFTFFVGVLAFSFLFVGCSGKKGKPEELAKNAQKQVNEARFMDADIDMKIALTMEGQTQNNNISGNFKVNRSGKLPVSLFDFSLDGIKEQEYISQEGIYDVLLGEVSEEIFTPEVINQMEQAKNVGTSFDIYQSVVFDDKENELKATVNKDKIKEYIEKSAYYPILRVGVEKVGELDMNITELIEVFVLDKDNNVVEMRAQMVVDVMGIPMNMTITMKFNNLNKELDVQTPSEIEKKVNQKTTAKAA